MDSVTEQQVFMLFFAIIWGAVANVQPRWKAFQWPLVGRHRPATNRVILSVIFLNIVPLLLFAYVFWALKHHSSNQPNWPVTHLLFHGIVPAFALFGCYRAWLATVETWPSTFYSAKGGVKAEWEHVEPTFRMEAETRDAAGKDLPIVYLGSNTACGNLVAALVYAIVGLAAPWICA